MVPHQLHGAVAPPQGFQRVRNHGGGGVLSRLQGLFRHTGAAEGDLAVAVGGGGPGVGQVMGRLPQERGLFRPALVPDLVRRQGHAHAHGGVGPGALGHHVRDGPDHLPVGFADLEPDLFRVDPAV